MNVETEKKFKKIGSSFAIIIAAAILLFASGIVPTPKLVQNKDTSEWHIIFQGSLAQASEGDPGTGVSGFLEIFFLNHSATPDTSWLTNSSSNMETWANANLAGGSGNAWANADNFNLELKHSTNFDIVVRCRFNKTNCWNGTQFIGSDTRVNISTSGTWGTMTEQIGTSLMAGNSTTSDYLYTNTYWQDFDGGTGSGFTLTKGSTGNNIDSIIIWARY